MLNGLAKWDKHFQIIPPGYEGKVRKLCEAAEEAGRRVVLVLGGDGEKWSLDGSGYFNKVCDDFIAMCNIEYHVVCVSGAHWFEAMVMADKWHGPTCDSSSEIYRVCIRDCLEYVCARLQQCSGKDGRAVTVHSKKQS